MAPITISGHIFTGPKADKEDILNLRGPDDTYVVQDCVFDMRPAIFKQDEAIDGVCGAKITLRRCLFINCEKTLLAGNGDYPQQDAAGATWDIEDCVFINSGRRCPDAQHGAQVTMRRCWVHDWGQAFNERAFGAWARTGATINASDCLFTQSGTRLNLGLLRTGIDVLSHVGNSINMYGLSALFNSRSYLPGVCRGLTEDDGGKVSAINCYKNRPWIVLDNSEGEISEGAARQIVLAISESSKFMHEYLGSDLISMFERLIKVE